MELKSLIAPLIPDLRLNLRSYKASTDNVYFPNHLLANYLLISELNPQAIPSKGEVYLAENCASFIRIPSHFKTETEANKILEGNWNLQISLEYMGSDSCVYNEGEENFPGFESMVIEDENCLSGIYRIICQLIFVPVEDCVQQAAFFFEEIGRLQIFNSRRIHP